jgi:hypothetical protein
MFGMITRVAFALDEWLQRTLGRPYNLLLTVGLVIEIVHRLYEAPDRYRDTLHLPGEILVTVMEVALLIHQVGALSHRIDRHKAHRARAKAKASGSDGPEA